MEVEKRVEELAEQQEIIVEQLKELVDTVQDINNAVMARTYRDIVASGQLEELRQEFPEEIERLEEVAESFLAPEIARIEDEMNNER